MCKRGFIHPKREVINNWSLLQILCRLCPQAKGPKSLLRVMNSFFQTHSLLDLMVLKNTHQYSYYIAYLSFMPFYILPQHHCH